MTKYTASALAHSNIALVKYWGKRDSRLNLPAVGSISLTLDALRTKTTVTFSKEIGTDFFRINGKSVSPAQFDRLTRFVDIVRKKFDNNLRIEVESENNFPTGAGLASSASGFAALTEAIDNALSLGLSAREKSVWARQGSGSAARSVFGGIVEMHHGISFDGKDDYAEQLFDENYWDLRLLVLVTSEAKKTIGSTEGMNRTSLTSPYFQIWTESSEVDLAEMRSALRDKDFQKLGEISERSCLKMHGLAMSADPGILYWNAATVRLIHKIRALRTSGIPAFFTIDAGPQVKVLCLPDSIEGLFNEFRSEPGVKKVIQSKLGSGTHTLRKNQ